MYLWCVSVTIRCRSKHHPTAETVKSTEWLCVSLSKNILEREKLFRYEQNSEKTSRPGMRECPLHYLSWQNGFRQRYGEWFKTETTKNKNERITNMQKQKLCIPCVGLPSFAVVPGLFCKGSMVASCFWLQGKGRERMQTKYFKNMFQNISQELQIQRQRTAG